MMNELAETKTERLQRVNSLYVIQNADKIARTNDYSHLPKDSLLVHGIFATLQGEGPYVGSPCVFLRLAGCNLGDKRNGFCAFCDTDFKLENGKIMSFTSTLEEIERQWNDKVRGVCEKLIIITGGEPGIQPFCFDFIKYAVDAGWAVQVETNGTQRKFADAVRDYVIGSRATNPNYEMPKISLVVSPKAGVNGYGFLDIISWAFGKNALKVLVEERVDSPHNKLPEYVETWRASGHPVYLSPIAVYLREYKGEISDAWEDGLINRELTRKNYNYAAKLALKNGFKLSIQQHLFAAIA